MSEYPPDWEVANLGTYLKETKERVSEGNTTPYSVSKVLGIVPQSEKFKKRVASNDISNYKIIRKGDFAYDPMLLWDGSINRMLREDTGAVSPAYVTFRVLDNSLDADYLLHFLKADTAKNFYKSISKGTNVRRQKAEFRDFASGEFAFPPLPEQKKIAEILSGIDIRKKSLTRQREKLQVAYKALSGELLGSLPRKVPLNDICDLQVGFPFRSADFSEAGVRLLRGENVGYGAPNWERAQFLPNSLAEASSMYQVNTGDIVIGMDRSFTKSGFKVSKISSADLPCLLVQRVGRFAPKSISTNFLWHILQSPDYQRVLLSSEKGMDIPHLSKGEILEPLVPVADAQTQKQVSNSLDSMLKSIRSVDASIAATSQLGAALQSELLSGRMRVSI